LTPKRHSARRRQDLGTGKEQKISITASSGLSKDDIEKMRKDAEAHAEDDKQAREAVETRNGSRQCGVSLREDAQGQRRQNFGDDKGKIEKSRRGREGSVEGQTTRLRLSRRARSSTKPGRPVSAELLQKRRRAKSSSEQGTGATAAGRKRAEV